MKKLAIVKVEIDKVSSFNSQSQEGTHTLPKGSGCDWMSLQGLKINGVLSGKGLYPHFDGVPAKVCVSLGIATKHLEDDQLWYTIDRDVTLTVTRNTEKDTTTNGYTKKGYDYDIKEGI